MSLGLLAAWTTTSTKKRMSKACEEEDEDVERFHDSLDRLLSSSNTSCSCSRSSSYPPSDDEVGEEREGSGPVWNSGSPDIVPVPRFPMGVSNSYDVWISQPFSSVEERRFRLLSQMGLSRDPSLLRHRPSLSFSSSSADTNQRFEVTRSVSADRFSGETVENNNDNSIRQHNTCLNFSSIDIDSRVNSSELGIVRSKSDGDCNSSCKKPEILSFNNSISASSPVVCRGGSSSAAVNNEKDCTHDNGGVGVDKSRDCDGSPMLTHGVMPNKPPRGKFRSDSTHSAINCDVEGNGDVTVDDSGCYTIKDLDNGKEFVVNEVREDGMWNKLKEVGTGRQLTMEEFEMCVGTSPIVQELMRRQSVEDGSRNSTDSNGDGSAGTGSKLKKGSWLKSIKNMASSVTGYKERRSSDERDTSSEKGGRRSSSATDDSQDTSFHGPERVRVRQYGKSFKELAALYKSQEMQAHNGSIWAIRFSLDGKYLATAGEDCVIHVWQVVESDRKGDLLFDKPEDGNLNLMFMANGSPARTSISVSPCFDNHLEKKRKGRSSISRKSVSLEHILVPETVFGLSDKPFCTFRGHLDDVLDLSWSKSQHLLSSSMDKTVRLWHFSSKSCLKIFSHSDYVTCIQFNPVNDGYFISGSLDAKVRVWSIHDGLVVDWSDLHEMVTAACYTPDGQGALVGTYKGSCRLYNTTDNKLLQKGQINLQNKKKSHRKKITGFQFVPGSTSEVLITSADSRIRVADGVDLVHKFKGFRNTNSQISASVTANGKYVVCASEDSYVYVWKHEADSRPSRSKGVTVTQSYEHFHCQDVSVAIPWPGMCNSCGVQDTCLTEQSGSVGHLDDVSTVNHPPTPVEGSNGSDSSLLASGCTNSPLHGIISSASNSYFFDRISATWPEEKLISATENCSPRVSVDFSNGFNQSKSAWGMVIVTASVRGEIRIFQNFGLPVRI